MVDARKLKLAILEVFAAEPGRTQHRVNVVGRPYQAGALEARLSTTFSANERATALRLFEQMASDGLIESTLSGVVDPQAWFVITERGQEALSRGVLDPLDAALLALSPDLCAMRAGARSALMSREPDSLRQAAHSGRELIEQVLHLAAPDDLVKQQPGFSRDDSSRSGITRRHRLRYILRKAGGSVSDSDLRVVETSIEHFLALHARILAQAHSRTALTRTDVEGALSAVEDALLRLLVGH